MAAHQPSQPEHPSEPAPGGAARPRLDRAPGDRYRGGGVQGGATGGGDTKGSASPGGAGDAGGSQDAGVPARPILRAVTAGVVGAVGLIVVGAILASTEGLLFVSAVTGAAIGLLAARLAVPSDPAAAALPRSTARWLEIAIALAAVLVADASTWIYAVREGGTLGPVDYLFTTFGPFVPGELLFAGLGAAWGATSGPVQS